MAALQDLEKFLTPYVEIGKEYVQEGRHYINEKCSTFEAWQLIACTGLAVVVVLRFHRFLFDSQLSLFERLKLLIFRLVRYIPFVQAKIDAEIGKARISIAENLNQPFDGCEYMTELPKKGMSDDEILRRLTDYTERGNFKWKQGMVSGTVYGGGPATTALNTNVYEKTVWTNPLHPDVFPGIRKMEAEIVSWGLKMCNGDKKSCGVVTSGGTESILLACLAYRNLALERGIEKPTIVMPHTGHAAFDKAAHMFGMHVVHVPMNSKTLEVDMVKYEHAISKNTAMLVGSTPDFAHGMMDPMDKIGKLGLKYGIPVHLDCCLGGWLVQFMVKAGFEVPQYDFSTPGVTGISADTHKYGCTPKGSSVLLFSDGNYRKYHYFVQPNWPGGVYASPTLAGSRAGGNIATCWATLLHYGEEGYIELTRKIVSTRIYLQKEIVKIEGLKILGNPQTSVLPVDSDVFNIFRLAGKLTKRGWNLNPLQFPKGFHIALTMLWTQEGIADKFLKDLRECVAKIMKNPKKEAKGIAAVYGTAQMVQDRSVISDIGRYFIDACYDTDQPVLKSN